MKKEDPSTTDFLRAQLESNIAFSPRDEYSPTPLDPYNTIVGGAVPYEPRLAARFVGRAVEFQNAFGLPDDVYGRGSNELIDAHGVRCKRNNDSLARLKDAINWDNADPELLSIIQKARQAAADPQELLRLIKEYPDMISVEFFKSHPLFDIRKHEEVRRQLMGRLILLQQSFQDAEIILNSTEDNTDAAKHETTDTGVIILKQVFGKALSKDSETDIVVKQSMILTPDTTPLPVQSLKTRLGSNGYNVLPLGVSAYFRTTDYKQRLGRLGIAKK